MKKITRNLVLFLFLAAGMNAMATGEVDSIISQHIRAHGGTKAWAAIRSMKITGQFTSFSETKPFTEIKARGGKYFADLYKGQHRVTEGCDGEICWVDNPWFELGFPHIANAAEDNVIRQKAEFCTPFFDYKTRGFTVDLEGTEEAEGRMCYKLKLTRDNGLNEIWYLDTATCLEVTTQSRWADFATPAVQEAFYDDFREINGVVLPFYIERTFGIRFRQVEVENIAFNTDPDPAIFNMPVTPEMQKLSFMQGEWKVAHEAMTRSGSLRLVDSVDASIAFLPHKNLVEENISYTSFYPVERVSRWSFSRENNNYLMNAFNSFYSQMNLYQGNFSGDTLLLDNAQIRLSEADTAKAQFSRFAIYPLESNKMVVEQSRSRDKGANWSVVQRFTYVRKEPADQPPD